MAKEHASVGLSCLAMKSKHYSPRAITFPPAYKNLEKKNNNSKALHNIISKGTDHFSGPNKSRPICFIQKNVK